MSVRIVGGVQERLPAHGRAAGLDQLTVGHRLEDVARGARLERLEAVLLEVVHREHEHAQLRAPAGQLARRLETGAARHRDVEHRQVDVLARARARPPRCRRPPPRRPRGPAPRPAPCAGPAARRCGRRRSGSGSAAGRLTPAPAAGARSGPPCRPSAAGARSAARRRAGRARACRPCPPPRPAASPSSMPRPSSRTRSDDSAVDPLEDELDVVRLGVAGDVGQALLGDAVDRRGPARRRGPAGRRRAACRMRMPLRSAKPAASEISALRSPNSSSAWGRSPRAISRTSSTPFARGLLELRDGVRERPAARPRGAPSSCSTTPVSV